MGHKHTKAEMLEGALDAALDDGLSRLTFGRLAKRLGISDRVIVYYFPTKDDLLGEVILHLGLKLQEALGAAFTEPAEDHRALTATAWPILAAPEHDRTFALFFEANGLAATGTSPFVKLVPQLIEAWISWLTEFFIGTEERCRAEAEAAIALVDGLLLVRLLAGPEAGDRAATTLGVA